MVKPRHTPIRTCVACRATDEKRDLLRVVRQPDGSVRYDPKGKLSGRGAYVCARVECIALARKQKRLERSLKVNGIPEDLFTELGARAAALAAETGNAHGQPLASVTLTAEPAASAPTQQARAAAAREIASAPQKSEVEKV